MILKLGFHYDYFVLGLKLLTDDLSCSNNPKDMDRNEILADVNVACRTAVDILNDLLCLDKMESGVMEVHKHEVPVVSFILDCVGMFSAQAREGCVAMSVVTTTDKITQSADSNERTKQSGDSIDRITQSSDFQSHLSLLDSDIVSIDRFKMDQVVRNLISNALKFTPKGGSVVVTASFVPNHTVDPVSIGGTCPSSRSNTIMTRLIDSTKSVPVPKTKRFAKRFSKIHVGPDYLEGDADSSKDIEVPTTIAGKLVIVVKDTGVGMLEKNYCRLFKEIVQFNPEVLQAGGGSGLGLWITKGIVDLHGGSVRAHSEGLGQGSSFVVELLMERKVRNSSRLVNPLVSAAKDAPLSYFDCHVKDDIGEGSQKAVVLHLLVVDDSPLNRKMLLRTLRAVGHICEEAEDGLEAIVRVKARMASTAKSYSAILIDFVMPNMDGPTATKEIRAMGYTAPIFGVTGNGLTSDIDHFMSCGVNEVLLKPLNVADLYRSLKQPHY